MQPFIRKSIVIVGYLFSALVLLTGFLVIIASVFTIYLNHHRTEIENTVSTMLDRPITVQRLHLRWYHYYYPEIDFDNATVLDEQTQAPKLSIQRIRMNFNPWESLLHQKIVIRSITLTGVDITVKQEHSGMIKIGNIIAFNMRDQSTGALLQPNNMMAWIFSQRRLALEDIRLHFIIQNQPQRDIYLNKFVLRNSQNRHLITGDMTLIQEKNATLSVSFDWEGDIQHYLIANGKLHLDLNNLSLATWIGAIHYKDFQVTHGFINGTLAVDWKNNQWMTTQVQAEGDNIDVQGNSTPLNLHIDQVSTNLNTHQNSKIATDGNIAIKNGNILLKNNPLSLTQVNGSLTLSKNTLTSNNITAQLMNDPATMTVKTHDQSVLINLASQTTVSQLEQAFHVSLAQIMHGAFHYQLNLALMKDSTQSNLVIDSDLKGLSIQAPDNLGKTPTEIKNIHIILTIPDASTLMMKGRYNTHLTAALLFKAKNGTLQLSNGEIRLGQGEAQLQKNAGLLMTMITPTLNIETWKNYLDSFKTNTAPMKPSELPALFIKADTVTAGNYRINNVILNTEPTNQGMLIKQFSIHDPSFTLETSGDWINATSHLNGTLSTSDINSMLKNFGFAVSNFKGTTANLPFDLNWNGPVYSPTLSKMHGTLSIKLGAGVITGLSDSTNAKIDLANFINLFSLSTLPGLNFNPEHSSERGYVFQSVSGKFDLHDGNANTDDLVFISSIAGISIKGRIGLAAKDFDLQMGVTSHITGALPLVTTLAAGAPVVGLAALAVTKVVSGASSSQAETRYQYHVTGSWSKPTLSPITP